LESPFIHMGWIPDMGWIPGFSRVRATHLFNFLCCVVFVCLVHPMLLVFLNCPFLICLSFFYDLLSNTFHQTTVWSDFRNILCLSLRKCFRATFVFCSQKTAIYLHLCDKSLLSHKNKINFVFRVSFAVLQNSFKDWFNKSTSAVPCGLMSEKIRRLYI
jgi:hypothetical protein